MEEFFKLLESLAAHEGLLTSEDVNSILKNPSNTLRLAVATAVGAQNRVTASKGDLDVAMARDAALCQKQAALWLDIHQRQVEVEERKRYGAESGWTIDQMREEAERASSGNQDKPVT